jgi:hypothetical protein
VQKEKFVMSIRIIGTGVGRTGTLSLKLALTELGFGPCYHMTEVMEHMPVALPLWQAAVSGKPDFDAIYSGYTSAVDWPTAGFFRELFEKYPDAKFVHTTRSARAWAESFSETIYEFLKGKENAPPEMRPRLDMAEAVIEKTGFAPGLTKQELEARFVAHDEAVRAAIPSSRLLIFNLEHGWQPLCTFLGVPVPSRPFPRTNDREAFWKLVRGEQ